MLANLGALPLRWSHLGVVDFNLAKANVVAETIRDIIQAKILKLGFKRICSSIFQQLCPGYSDQPHAALEHIRHSVPGPDGQIVTASVIKYFQRMMNAVRPFATEQTYASAYAIGSYKASIDASYLAFDACTQRIQLFII